MDNLELTNNRIKTLFERTKNNQDLLLIEATVDTGFEKVAIEELILKFSELNEHEYCLSPGRIYFCIKILELTRINNLRSVDNFSIVVYSDNINFQSNKDEDLKIFTELANQIEFSKGLSVWLNFTECPIQFHDLDLFTNNEFKFRITGIRSYKHAFTSMEAASNFGGIINDRFLWKVSMVDFHLEILLYIVANRVTIALKLTRRSNHRRNIAFFGPTTLRATVCYNLLLLAKPKPGDIIVDPLCGGGSIPIECALAFPETVIFCGDNHERAIERTYNNLEAIPNISVHHFAWDATNLPFKDNSVDVIVTDLPFGKRSGSFSDNRVLYMKILLEFGRIAKPNVTRMVLLTNDRRSLLNAMNKNKKQYWNKGQLLAVKLGGLKPLVSCFKRNKLIYEPYILLCFYF